ncbi:extracellular solute-binding protein [Haladaptatus salinisoli]|uniref:extracellular solute-binding protein n=1 Tax=Haladaptatus salinisoli TaxID=2884876 RepID=UPI001D0A1D09|nr:extracellular solute-binding protein [Haladaptatus salinisoli]
MRKQATSDDFTRRSALKLGTATGMSALLGGLAGCLGGESDKSSGKLVAKDQIGSGDAKTSLTYWMLPDQSHTATENKKVAKVVEKFFRTWAKNHSDAGMQIEYQTNLEQMKTKLLQVVARGGAPSMSQVDSFWVPNFYKDLQPVTDAIEDPDDWYPFVKDVVVRGGEWKAVWKNTDCRALYYRQDLIDKYNDGKPPETWDELINVGKTIKEKEGMNGYMYNGGKWEATTFDNLAMFWAQGGDLVNDQGKPVLGDGKNKKALLNVFKFFKRTIDSGVTPKRIANINDYALLRQAALNDETAMFLGGNWQIAVMKQKTDKKTWENWKVAKIPQMRADMASTGTGGWTEGVFTSNEQERKAAADFAGLYAKKENMATYCKAAGNLPTRKSVYEGTKFFSEDPYMQVYKKLLENGRARPGYPIYLTISSEWQTAAGKVITGQASPEKAVNTMIRNVNSQYNS